MLRLSSQAAAPWVAFRAWWFVVALAALIGYGCATVQVTRLLPSTANAQPKYFTPCGEDNFLFVANDGIHGEELWKLNRTGAEMFLDLLPGTSSSYPHGFHSLPNGRVAFFAASNPNFFAAEFPSLFVTDGERSEPNFAHPAQGYPHSPDTTTFTTTPSNNYTFVAIRSAASESELWSLAPDALSLQLSPYKIPGLVTSGNHLGCGKFAYLPYRTSETAVSGIAVAAFHDGAIILGVTSLAFPQESIQFLHCDAAHQRVFFAVTEPTGRLELFSVPITDAQPFSLHGWTLLHTFQGPTSSYEFKFVAFKESYYFFNRLASSLSDGVLLQIPASLNVAQNRLFPTSLKLTSLFSPALTGGELFASSPAPPYLYKLSSDQESLVPLQTNSLNLVEPLTEAMLVPLGTSAHSFAFRPKATTGPHWYGVGVNNVVSQWTFDQIPSECLPANLNYFSSGALFPPKPEAKINEFQLVLPHMSLEMGEHLISFKIIPQTPLRFIPFFDFISLDLNLEQSILLGQVNGELVLSVNSLALGDELWISAGTAQTTRLLQDLTKGCKSTPRIHTGHSGEIKALSSSGRERLFFAAQAPETNLLSLFTTDGLTISPFQLIPVSGSDRLVLDGLGCLDTAYLLLQTGTNTNQFYATSGSSKWLLASDLNGATEFRCLGKTNGIAYVKDHVLWTVQPPNMVPVAQTAGVDGAEVRQVATTPVGVEFVLERPGSLQIWSLKSGNLAAVAILPRGVDRNTIKRINDTHWVFQQVGESSQARELFAVNTFDGTNSYLHSMFLIDAVEVSRNKVDVLIVGQETASSLKRLTAGPLKLNTPFANLPPGAEVMPKMTLHADPFPIQNGNFFLGEDYEPERLTLVIVGRTFNRKQISRGYPVATQGRFLALGYPETPTYVSKSNSVVFSVEEAGARTYYSIPSPCSELSDCGRLTSDNCQVTCELGWCKSVSCSPNTSVPRTAPVAAPDTAPKGGEPEPGLLGMDPVLAVLFVLVILLIAIASTVAIALMVFWIRKRRRQSSSSGSSRSQSQSRSKSAYSASMSTTEEASNSGDYFFDLPDTSASSIQLPLVAGTNQYSDEPPDTDSSQDDDIQEPPMASDDDD